MNHNLRTAVFDTKGKLQKIVMGNEWTSDELVEEITKAAMDRNYERSNFEAYYDATDFLCCPSCECIGEGNGDKRKYHSDNNGNYCEPKLKDCKDEICDICEEVKKTFCCEEEKKKDERCAD